MTITIDYQKRKNTNLFIKFQTNNSTNLTNIQNYIPIYERFFSLNSTNYNSINLNHQLYISDIKDINEKDICNENIFNCKLKNITDNVQVLHKNVFIKMAPLLDPFKYIIGKYKHDDPNLFNLPSFDKTTDVHPKIMEHNNSAYVDGFFSFLTNKALHEHNFIHGVAYYGSFLAIKNEYKLNIIDDIDYLVQSDFFNKQKNVLFNVEDFTHLLLNDDDKKPLKPLKISTSLKSNSSIKSIDDSMFENIFENESQHVSLTDIKNMGLDIVDITNSYEVETDTPHKTDTLRSGSTCSSRTSHTNDNDENDFMNNKMNFDDEDEDEDEDEEEEMDLEIDDNELEQELEEEKEAMDIDEYEDVDSDDEKEEKLILTFDKFPVQVICM